MARSRTMPRRFGRLQAGFRTPLAATILIMLLGLGLLGLSSTMPSVASIIRGSVNAIGIQAAFYYGLAALAAAWEKRSRAGSVGVLLTGIAWPLLSAAALFAVAFYSIPTLDLTALLVGVGGILSGILPLAFRWYLVDRQA